MKKVVALLLTFLLIVGLAGCNPGGGSSSGDTSSGGSDSSGESSGGADSSDPITIGVIDAFTGERATNGEYVREACEMFLDHINSEGGVLGREVQIVYEDDQGKEATGANAYQKIVAENDLSGIVLGKYSSVVLAQESFISESQIPSVCSGSSVNIDSSSCDYLYSVRKSDAGQGVTIANICQELGMTKVAILHAPDALGTTMSPIVEENLAEMGIEVVSIQQYATSEKNFSSYITVIANSGCDGLVSIGQSQEQSLIMMAVQDAGLEIPCVGSSSVAQQITVDGAGAEAAEGWYAGTYWSSTTTEEPAASWIAEYEDRFGRVPDSTSALTYDSLYLLCWAMEECGSDDPEAINEQLQKMQDVQGIICTYTFTEGSRMLASTEFLVHIEDGVPVPQGSV